MIETGAKGKTAIKRLQGMQAKKARRASLLQPHTKNKARLNIDYILPPYTLYSTHTHSEAITILPP